LQEEKSGKTDGTDGNGHLFASSCTNCFVSSKYITNTEKCCVQDWKNVHLNNTGEYILFSSCVLHHGYYNNRANWIFIIAQLYATPSEKIDVLCLTQAILEGQDFNVGSLEQSTLLELSNHVMHNRDTSYSLT
jgi:hypothetical protein